MTQERSDDLILELSCSEIGHCSLMEEKTWTDSSCKAWCEKFSWNGKDFPSKPEFFTKSQLRKVVETIADGDKEELKEKSWHYAEGIMDLLKEHDDMLLPKLLKDSLEKLQKYSEDESVSYLDWLNMFADLRVGIRTFLRILEKIDKKEV
jgi:hypothetical protein